MNDKPNRQEAIDDMAAFWLARAMSGSMDENEREALTVWINAAPENRTAYRELEGLLAKVDRGGQELLAKEYQRQMEEAAETVRPRAPLFSRMAAGFALAAMVGVAALTGLRGKTDAEIQIAHYETAIGEMKTVLLEDGSEAELNADTQLAVNFTEGARQVDLVSGEAFFNVEKDKSRPFTVKAGPATITVTGTSFNVSHYGQKTFVQVLTGVVAVAPIEGAASTLLAGDMIEIGPDGRPGDVTRYDPNYFLSWRTGKIRFRDEPLGDVVVALNRYFEKPIALGGDEIANLPVTGDFDIRDEETATKALALIFDLEIKDETSIVILEARRPDAVE